MIAKMYLGTLVVGIALGAAMTGGAMAAGITAQPAIAGTLRVSSVKGTELAVGERSLLVISPAGAGCTAVSSNPAVAALEQVTGYWVIVPKAPGAVTITVTNASGETAFLTLAVKEDTSAPVEVDLNANMEIRQEIVRLINEERRANGLSELPVYRRPTGALAPETITVSVHMTVTTVKKYLSGLAVKGLINEDGTPALKCEGAKFFTLPNEIFLLCLPPSAFLIYAYLLLIKDRRSHTCHPSYNTIAAATGISKNTAIKSIDTLLEMGLITVEPSSYFDKCGLKWKGNNLYTILWPGFQLRQLW